METIPILGYTVQDAHEVLQLEGELETGELLKNSLQNDQFANNVNQPNTQLTPEDKSTEACTEFSSANCDCGKASKEFRQDTSRKGTWKIQMYGIKSIKHRHLL